MKKYHLSWLEEKCCDIEAEGFEDAERKFYASLEHEIYQGEKVTRPIITVKK